MKRRKTMLGASLVGIAAAATLGLTSAAVAAVDQHPAPPSAQAPKMCCPSQRRRGRRSRSLRFLRRTTLQAVAQPALGIESLRPQPSTSRVVPKGSRPGATAVPYATVPSLPISNAARTAAQVRGHGVRAGYVGRVFPRALRPGDLRRQRLRHAGREQPPRGVRRAYGQRAFAADSRRVLLQRLRQRHLRPEVLLGSRHEPLVRVPGRSPTSPLAPSPACTSPSA